MTRQRLSKIFYRFRDFHLAAVQLQFVLHLCRIRNILSGDSAKQFAAFTGFCLDFDFDFPQLGCEQLGFFQHPSAGHPLLSFAVLADSTCQLSHWPPIFSAAKNSLRILQRPPEARLSCDLHYCRPDSGRRHRPVRPDCRRFYLCLHRPTGCP